MSGIYFEVNMKNIIWLAIPLFVSSVHANVILNNTRVIFNENQKETILKVHNDNAHPVLIQTWVDDGVQQHIANPPKTPFTMLPPIFRMETQQGHLLRIIYDGQTLPKDRESIYWINVFEVPPKDANLKDSNTLQIAFRTRIKLFFRPESLKSPSIDDLANQIDCKMNKNSNNVMALSCKNNSAYYISFSKINIKNKILPLDTFGMIPPFGDVIHAHESLSKDDDEIVATIINDQGGIGEKKIKVRYE